jgi:uncharacterized protein (DUF433 family)
MTINDRIEINPKVMLGKPVIRGTRITVELIFRKLRKGASEVDLMEAYPRLTREDIRAEYKAGLLQGLPTGENFRDSVSEIRCPSQFYFKSEGSQGRC